jgi:hypothetical protein
MGQSTTMSPEPKREYGASPAQIIVSLLILATTAAVVALAVRRVGW